MASFTKRGDTWRAQIARAGVRLSETFPTKAEAKAWATAREAEILAGKYGRVARVTLRTAMERYRDSVSPTKRGERWEVVRLNAFIRDLDFVDKWIGTVTAADISSWRDARLVEVSGASVNRDMTLLRSVFEVARRDWGLLKENPMQDVRRPRQPPARTRLIADIERDKILNALGYIDGAAPETKSQQVALAFLLSLETAMRAGEVLSLTDETVDFDRRVATLAMTKNGEGREVPLSTRAVALCRTIMPGFSLSSDSLDALFRKARARAGVHDVHFHDARATALTRLSKKVDVLTLARIAGHRDLKTLMVYYRESASDISARLD